MINAPSDPGSDALVAMGKFVLPVVSESKGRKPVDVIPTAVLRATPGTVFDESKRNSVSRRILVFSGGAG